MPYPRVSNQNASGVSYKQEGSDGANELLYNILEMSVSLFHFPTLVKARAYRNMLVCLFCCAIR